MERRAESLWSFGTARSAEEPAPAPTLEDLLRPEDEDAALTLADLEDEQ